MSQAVNADYWNSVADRVKKHHLEQNIAVYKREEHIKLIKKWGGELRGKKVLKTDIYEEAFGEDHFLFWLLDQGAEVFAIDISHKIAAKARQRLRQPNPDIKIFLNADVRACPFKDESFDLIISNSTLDNLYTVDVPKSLLELRRILKKNGVLILTLDNAHNPLYYLGYILEKILKTNKYYQGRCYSLKEAKALASKNNFIIQESTAIVHIPTPFNKCALLMQAINPKLFTPFIKRAIGIFSNLSNARSKFLTGWFIALKLTKI